MSVRGEPRSLQSGRPGAPGSTLPGTLRRRWLRRAAPVDVLQEGAFPYVVLKRDQLYRRLLAMGDMLATTTALLVAVLLVGDDGLKPAALLIAPLTLLVVKTLGLYDRDQHLLHKSTLDEGPQLFLVATVFVLLVWLAAPLCIDGSLTRLQVAGFWFLLFALLVLTRAVMRRVAGHIVATERCLVIGDAAIADRLVSKMGRSVLVRANVVGRIPMSGRERIADEDALELARPRPAGSLAAPLLGSVQQLPDVVADHMIHRVIIAPGSEESDELLDLIRAAKVLGVKVSIVPRPVRGRRLVGRVRRRARGWRCSACGRYGLSASSALLKRAFDVVCSRASARRAHPAVRGRRAGHQADLAGPRVLPSAAHRPARPGLRHAQVPHDGARTRRSASRRSSAATRLRGCSRSPTIRASRASGVCCAGRRSTSSRSSSTCCAAR